MIKKVNTSDYLKIAKENKVFLWHFLQKDQCNTGCLTFFSYFDDSKLINNSHPIREVIDLIKIPYFESLTEESVDFLIENGIPEHAIWKNKIFDPIIIGFKNGVIVSHTAQKCYCVEGLIEIISELDPTYLQNVN